MRHIAIGLCALMLAGCGELNQAAQDAQQLVQAGQQAIETGKQVVEMGKQAVDAGKQIAESEIAQRLQTYLQQKYDTVDSLRQAMFSGDGQLLTEQLQQTELANFTFWRSDLLGLEFRGRLTADGTFQVLRYDLTQPNAEPTIVKEFRATLGQDGQIHVQ